MRAAACVAAGSIAAGCVAVPEGAGPTCDPAPPRPGEVLVGGWCADRAIDGGEGRRGDAWLASAHLRVVLRHPEASRTLVGLGGGTAVDLAPWGGADAVHELVPLVGGGWLDVDGFALEADGAVVRGRVRALPGQPPLPEARAEVRWRLDPDAPALRVEGADGLWLHPRDALGRVGAAWLGEARLVSDATEVRDHGGAIALIGATALAVAAHDDPTGWLGAGSVRVSGSAPEATHLRVRGPHGDVVIPLPSEALALWLPAEVEAVRAEAGGRAASAWAAPGEDLALALGPAATIEVRSPVAATVRWTHADGRRGAARIPAGGGRVATGAGDVDLVVQASPASAAVKVRVHARGLTALALDPPPGPPGAVPVALRWPADRARSFRGSDADAVAEAVGAGLVAAVLTPEDEVADGLAHPLVRAGSLLSHPDGWRISSWPWSPTRAAGHGAVDARALTPEEALLAAWGGPGSDRFTVVDLAWLDAAPSPPQVWPPPTAAWLDAPDAGFSTWAPWFAWLEAGVALAPAGPVSWAAVPAPDAVMGVEIERALLLGEVVAGSGPWIALEVGGLGPGGTVAARPALPRPVWITGWSADEDVDLWLIVDGAPRHVGRGPGPHAATLRGGRWVVGALTGPGGAWAVTAPVWLRR